MRPTRVFMTTLLFTITLLSTTFAQNYTQWELPEGAKLRLGKGKLSNHEGHLTTIGKGKSYYFSPDSTQLTVMTSIGIWVYDVMTGEEISLTTGNGISIHRNAVVSTDSQMYAIPRNHRIEIWDLKTNHLKTTYRGSTERVLSVTFSPDGQMLATTEFSGIIRIWDIGSGKYHEIPTPYKIVSRVMFSPNGKMIVSSRGRDVRLWDTVTGKFKVGLEDTVGVDNIVFNSDGSALYGFSKNGNEVRFWDTDTGKVKLRLGPDRSYRHLFALSPDGKTLAIARRNDYKVQLWDTQSGHVKNTLLGDTQYVKLPVIANGIPQLVNYSTNSVESLAFSPDGLTLAVSSDDGIALWDPETAKPKFLLPIEESIYYLMFSPDGRSLVARSVGSHDDTRILLWNIDMTDIQNSGLRHIITGHYDEVSSVAFNPDGKILAGGYHLENIKLWDVVNGQLKTICDGFPYQTWVNSVTFTPDGKTLASLYLSIQSSGGKTEILLWDAKTGEYQKTLKGHGKAIGSTRPIGHGGGIAFIPDSKMFVSGSLDGTIQLWNTKTLEKDSKSQRFGSLFGLNKAKLEGHTDQIFTVALSPDGNTIASGSKDKTIRLWNVNNRKHITTLEGHTDEILTVTFSPDGVTLASGCRSGSIHLWDVKTGKHNTSLIGNDLFTRPNTLPPREDDPPNITGRRRSAVSSLVFSHDGKTLINGNSDGTIHFWNMSTLQIKSTFSGQNWLKTLALSPDGRTLATGNADGTVLIWDVKP